MKKIHSVVATALLATATAFSGGAAFATDSVTAEHTSQQIDASDYIYFPGDIVEVKQSEDRLTLFVEDAHKEPAHLIITENTLLLDADTGESVDADSLKEGVAIDAYYNKHKFMILIYPPQIAPEIVIVRGEQSGQAKVGKFNEDFISLDNELKLHIADETTLVNQQGEPIEKADLNGKELIVFYDIATKSIPAQTTPSKIIAMDPIQTEPAPAPEPAPFNPEPDEAIKPEPQMVQLRAAVESLGYDLEWDEETSSVTLSQEDQEARLTIGSTTYTLNGQTHSLDAAPEIIEGRTYLPDSFIASITK